MRLWRRRPIELAPGTQLDLDLPSGVPCPTCDFPIVQLISLTVDHLSVERFEFRYRYLVRCQGGHWWAARKIVLHPNDPESVLAITFGPEAEVCAVSFRPAQGEEVPG